MKIIIASSNQGKIKELRALLKPLQIELSAQSDLNISDVAETGLTFVENAIIKARHACTQGNLPALADDSGLIVPYLQGEPGIYSARFAGSHSNAEANIDKLLLKLGDVPEDKRDAYFYCVIVFMRHPKDPAPIIAEGQWHGKIVSMSQGTAGFGYDPIFFVASENKTAAELSPIIKNKISHRGKAIESFINQLTSANLKHESIIR